MGCNNKERIELGRLHKLYRYGWGSRDIGKDSISFHLIVSRVSRSLNVKRNPEENRKLTS